MSPLHGLSDEVLSGMSELELAASFPIVTEDADAEDDIEPQQHSDMLEDAAAFRSCSTTRTASQANLTGDCERPDARREHPEVSLDRPNTRLAHLKPPLAC